MNYEYVSTHDLRVGDVVLSDGMRLLIDQEIVQSKGHPVTDHGGACLWTAARVLNWDEIVKRAETDKYIAGFIAGVIRSDMSPDGHRARNALPPYTEPRWAIQGNGLAQWARVIKEDN